MAEPHRLVGTPARSLAVAVRMSATAPGTLAPMPPGSPPPPPPSKLPPAVFSGAESSAAEMPSQSIHATDNGLLLEVAWEVCNPIGGIFQVIRSKAPAMVEKWGDRYCLVGPYNHQHA